MSTDQTAPERARPRPSTNPRGRILPHLAGRAPAAAPGSVLHGVSGATAVMLLLVAIGAALHEPVLIPPLAASAAIVHSAPGLPLAQPRSVIAGHLLCAAVGYAGLAAFGSSPWVAALAAGLALAVMTVARTPHSPACATAVVIVLGTPDPRTFVPLLAGAALLVVLAGVALSRARRTGPRYPQYWW
ncbi:HPP family protein [Streptomyces sp. PCS3-D2]|uniref:HPP family protein n=1 Tax=Streptomyces sp. PCS3-D2 TaxID=1460244 RepID=UPI00044CB64A|nr:HPP family protein [Streptomyces sp. PCS3-D2]WKV75351.1 HPP family protein [Streptomyces sp. PCS3-D2]